MNTNEAENLTVAPTESCVIISTIAFTQSQSAQAQEHEVQSCAFLDPVFREGDLVALCHEGPSACHRGDGLASWQGRCTCVCP